MFQIKLPKREEPYTFILNATPISSKNKDFLLTVADITKFEKEKQRLQFLADYDALTKVYNRRKINKELDSEVARAARYGQHFSIIMIDIDHFKKINDTYGHLAGDVVLMEFAELLQNKIRQTDLLGRYGGEEFILVMPSTSLDGAAEIANRLRQYVASFNFTTVGHITCSMGVAEYEQDENSSTFVKRADDALYAAKRNGRNRVEIAGKSSTPMSCE
jgi:diguanylate cyclase (GGDEF)-like protein